MTALPNNDVGAEADDASVDPRVRRTLGEIRSTVLRLLADGGLEAVTHARVAEESAVSRATVYRHFPTIEKLIGDTLDATVPPMFAPTSTGDTAGDLRRFARRVAGFLREQQALPDLLKLAHRAKRDPELAAARRHVVSLPDSPVAPLLREGVRNGQLRVDLDIEVASAALLGPIFGVRILELTELTDEFVDKVVDGWLHGYGAAT